MLRRNRPFSTLLVFMFLITMILPIRASAAYVTVGTGSYMDTLPQGFVAPQSDIYKTSNITGPTPTNDWTSSVVWEKYSEVLYAHPLAFKCTNMGLQVAKPPKTFATEADGETNVLMELNTPDFTMQSTTFAPTEARADKFTDWGIDILMPNGQNSIKATLAHGSPYAYFTYTGGNPKIVFSAVPTVFFGNDGSKQYLGVTINGNNYGLFAPIGSTWSGIGTNNITCNLALGTSYFSVALLPDQTSLDTFKASAYAFITDTKSTWAYDQNTSTVTTTFTTTTTPKEGTNTNTIMALYPHQWRNNSSISPLAYSYTSIRGLMKTVSGKSFQTQAKYTGILPWLPNNAVQDSTIKARVQGLVDDYEGYGSTLTPPYISAGLDWQYSGYDTYWMGKNYGRLANIIPVAKQVGDTTAANAFMKAMQGSVEWWFTAQKYAADGSPVNDNFFSYDKNWGTLIGYHAGYGSNTSLNDHHFHYGYWINAAASIVLNTPGTDWGTDAKYGGMVKELINDIANTDRSSTKYPFLRNFDPYEGHSWASGDCNFTGDQRYVNSGNNQESSSEAVNAWVGMILYGEAIGDKSIRDTGIYLYTTETNAINNYNFDLDGDIFDKTSYKNLDAVQIWGGRYAHTTWWTEDPIEAHAINILPITSGSMYLGANSTYVKNNYNATYSEWPNYMTNYNAKGWTTNKDINMWQDVMCKYLSLSDPATALSKWSETPDPEFGETKAHTYDFIQTMNTVGTPDLTTTANTPLYGVFKKGASKTYVAYNVSKNPIIVSFSDGVQISVPANQMTSQTGGTATITAAPSISPAGGTFTTAQTVTITDNTNGSTIRYTTDGTTPKATSTVYSAPITVDSSKTIKAYATSTGLSDSAVTSETYTINAATQVATPTFNPVGGTYSTAQTVTISDATNGATIRYTTDGTTPTSASAIYSTPITVASTKTIKAYATASGMNNSTVASVTYTITPATDYTQVVIEADNSNANICFKSNVNSAWVDVHLKVNSGSQLNYRMVYNSSTGNWEKNIGGLTSGNVIDYNFTYEKSSLSYDTGWFNYAFGSIIVPTVPVAPTALTATATSSSQINLTWVDNAKNEIGYKVYRNTTNTKPAIATTTLLIGANTCQYEGLTANTTYYFWVEAYNTSGSSMAATVNAATQGGTTLTSTTWYLFNQATSGVTPLGENMQVTKSGLTGWQPIKTIGTTANYWYAPVQNGTYNSGTWNFTLWSSNNGSSSVKAELYKVSADGVTQTLLGTQTVDIGTTGLGNHPSTFNLSSGAVSLSNQRLMMKLVKIAGNDVTMCYNTNDFVTKLVTP